MRRYRGPISDHFDGMHFYNPVELGLGPRPIDALRWLATRKPGPWRDWIDDPPCPPPPERVSEGRLLATFVGHSTVLIQLDGINILCDPHWSERASPLASVGPRRHRAPGIRFEDLPPIDVVLQSHDHYDHFDTPTLRRIAAAWHPQFIAPAGVRSRFVDGKIAGGSEATELDWWQMVAVTGEIRITAVPARHFSGRGLLDRNETLWCGFVIEAPSGVVYFAGDTGYGPHFLEIKKKLPAIRLAFLPIGAFQPRWFMSPVHMSPSDAVQAHQDLCAAASIGIHFGTFRLADDAEDEPLNELQSVLDSAGERKPNFCTLGAGQGIEIPAVTIKEEATTERG
jgi:L-ascorbate metabolism protein UlaG (beta-lactamase superfamily)